MNVISIVITTIDEKIKAINLAEEIVSGKYAACVQIDEICSIFTWNSRHEQIKEYRLTIKVSRESVAKLIGFIKQLHTYDVPEIVVLDAKANEEYADWLSKNIANKNK